MEFSGLVFVDGGEGAPFLHIQDTFQMSTSITLIGTKKEKAQTAGKAARDVLELWIGFFGTPDKILANKGA